MKKMLLKFGLPVSFAVTLAVITIIGLTSTTFTSCKTKKCLDPNKPLSCTSAKSCCSTDHPYNDGHGSCWTDMASCRSTGYACEVCHVE